MELGVILRDIVAFLFAVVVLVPLCGRLGASPVLAYLAAGVLLGPNLLAVLGDAAALGALGEIGVLFLL